MLSDNDTIDYSVEAHTLDAHKTSAARQESTTRNLHGSITKNFHVSAAQNFHIIPSTSIVSYIRSPSNCKIWY